MFAKSLTTMFYVGNMFTWMKLEAWLDGGPADPSTAPPERLAIETPITRMIECLKQIAKAMNCYKIILNCSEKNIKFYEKCGFELKEVQMVHKPLEPRDNKPNHASKSNL